MIGKKLTLTKSVTAEMTAKAIGSGGLEVLGTPYMMALMECAAMNCMQVLLPDGKGSVGIRIESSHVAPTPVGMEIRAEAEITHISENGKVYDFAIRAFDEAGLIGEGTHQRAVIDNVRFLQKCNEKRKL
jgi:fluoroacetyl-CoA thioesterase